MSIDTQRGQCIFLEHTVYEEICLCFSVIFRGARNPEQTPVMIVISSVTHYSAQSTEARQVKCFAQGHKILVQQQSLVMPQL